MAGVTRTHLLRTVCRLSQLQHGSQQQLARTALNQWIRTFSVIGCNHGDKGLVFSQTVRCSGFGLHPAAVGCQNYLTTATPVFNSQESEQVKEKAKDEYDDIIWTGADVTFEDIKDAMQRSDVELLDCRTYKEVEKLGTIPTSIVIPLQEMPEAFNMSPDEFQKQYGFSKPPRQHDVIVYCRSGKRAKAACNFLVDYGYQHVKRYPGSWLEWVDEHPELKKHLAEQKEREKAEKQAMASES